MDERTMHERKEGETDREWGNRLTLLHGQAEKTKFELRYLIEELERAEEQLDRFLEGEGKGSIPSTQTGFLRYHQFTSEVIKTEYLARVQDFYSLTRRDHETSWVK
jgi:hypothetical protein